MCDVDRYRVPYYRSALCATVLASLLLVVGAPLSAQACSLDGIASIAANGEYAVKTTDGPNATSLKQWAPFTFGSAFAPGDTLNLSEDYGKLRVSLPAALLAIPFRWDLGDGHIVRGTGATHGYSRIGWYKVSVWGYWPSRHTWTSFDSVRVHIVPAGELWRANAGYRIMQVLAFLTRFLAYGGFTIFILIPVLWRSWRRRTRRRPTQPAPSA